MDMELSFSHRLKAEILDNKPLRARCRQAHAYGLFLYGRGFSAQEVSLTTESRDTAELFEDSARRFLGRNARIQVEEKRSAQKTIYLCTLPDQGDRVRMLEQLGGGQWLDRGLLDAYDKVQAFLAGAYLACGNMTDPRKSYHLEFVVRGEPLCDDLLELLEEYIPGARKSRRRGAYVAYYKEYGQIEDLMTLMGATKTCLAMIEVELFKGIRNQANRATNCETANIDKQVSAATGQVEDIALVLRERGESALTPQLLEAARLRMDNPDMSLRELCETSPTPISRSGMHHRLEKLSKMAAALREEGRNAT